jgi:ABC-2 type transport system permease protein
VALPHRWALLVAVLAVGAASFCALGLALASFIPNADAADAMVFGTLLPLQFISGVFDTVPADSILHRIADLFPVAHLFQAALAVTGPDQGLTPLGHLGIVAAWGLVGAVVGVRRFRWERDPA